MESIVEIDKLEIAKWFVNPEDKNTPDKGYPLMDEIKKPKYHPAHESTLSDSEKVAYCQELGCTSGELRQRTLDRITKWQEKAK